MNRKKVKFNLDKVDYNQCVPVQLRGLKACETCMHKDIKRGQEACPSPDIRRFGKNSLGLTVPVSEKEITPRK